MLNMYVALLHSKTSAILFQRQAGRLPVFPVSQVNSTKPTTQPEAALPGQPLRILPSPSSTAQELRAQGRHMRGRAPLTSP